MWEHFLVITLEKKMLISLKLRCKDVFFLLSKIAAAPAGWPGRNQQRPTNPARRFVRSRLHGTPCSLK